MFLRSAALYFVSLMTLAMQFQAYALEVDANAAVLYHPDTNTTVLSQNADEQLPPASLAKLMTLYILFDAIKANKVTLDSELPISEKAWRMGGSKMFLEVGKTVRVEDLIYGMAVSSGNDACIVTAEYLAGSEEAFADLMNQHAEKLGMSNTVFKNASGWPAPDMHTTAHDMALLAEALIEEHPAYYHYFSIPEFTYNGIRQTNRNRLLQQNNGVDGLKTGHTEEAGYHLVASAKQNGERLISVVMGTEGFSQREQANATLLRFGFNNYDTVTVANRYKNVGTVPVVHGLRKELPIVVANQVDLYLDKPARDTLTANITLKEPLIAPVNVGEEIGTMTITAAGDQHTVPLLAGEGTNAIGFWGKFQRSALAKIGIR